MLDAVSFRPLKLVYFIFCRYKIIIIYFHLSYNTQSIKLKFGLDDMTKIDSDPLLKQIAIFEIQARDNFEELDSHLENIEGVWDGN